MLMHAQQNGRRSEHQTATIPSGRERWSTGTPTGATHKRDSNVGQNRTCLWVKEGNDRREGEWW